MEKFNTVELMQAGVPVHGEIRYGEVGEECVSYAIIWFVDDHAVIAEPYSVNEKGDLWFYNRETDFSIVDVLD